eukprot:m.716376 g.716376  ORF g.716376 m.716376 type:complete len:92 (-) comp22984_c1_seq18:1569-1844(-)
MTTDKRYIVAPSYLDFIDILAQPMGLRPKLLHQSIAHQFVVCIHALQFPFEIFCSFDMPLDRQIARYVKRKVRMVIACVVHDVRGIIVSYT